MARAVLSATLVLLALGGAACVSTVGHLSTTSLDEYQCGGGFNLCSIQRSGNCPALSTSFTGLNAVGAFDMIQFAVAVTEDGVSVPTTCCTIYDSGCADVKGLGTPDVSTTLTQISEASICGGWVGWAVGHANTDNKGIGCVQSDCLARGVAYEFSVYQPDAPLFDNLAFANYAAYNQARVLGIEPTIIDFNRASTSQVPVWPRASC